MEHLSPVSRECSWQSMGMEHLHPLPNDIELLPESVVDAAGNIAQYIEDHRVQLFSKEDDVQLCVLGTSYENSENALFHCLRRYILLFQLNAQFHAFMSGLYPAASFLNHACRPNCQVDLDGEVSISSSSSSTCCKRRRRE